jgi:hypothetical protein
MEKPFHLFIANPNSPTVAVCQRLTPSAVTKASDMQTERDRRVQ